MLQYRTDLAMEAHELLCAERRGDPRRGVPDGLSLRVQRDERAH